MEQQIYQISQNKIPIYVIALHDNNDIEIMPDWGYLNVTTETDKNRHISRVIIHNVTV